MPVARRIAAGALVAITACSSTDSPVATGSLTIRVVGLHTSPPPPTGGSLTVRQSGGVVAFPGFVASSGLVTASVPVGDYSVGFNPPVGYQLASGQAAQLAVRVTSGQPDTATFNVTASVAAPAFLTVFADVQYPAAGPYPVDGGQVSGQRTDIPGQQTWTTTVPDQPSIGYLAYMELPPGRYSLVYTPPAGYHLSTSATIDTVVVAGATTTITWTSLP